MGVAQESGNKEWVWHKDPGTKNGCGTRIQEQRMGVVHLGTSPINWHGTKVERAHHKNGISSGPYKLWPV